MTKWRSIPSALPSRRRMRTAMAWKVPIQMAPAVRFRRCSTRPRISRAALLVNVTARISRGPLSAGRPAGSLVAAAAAAHPAGGHVVHVVVVIGARPVGRLQRLREGAEELVTQLHGRDLERVFEGPVIIGRVLALAGPQEKRDELHLDGRLEFGVLLGSLDAGLGVGFPLSLALALDGRDGERRNRALSAANAPGGTGGRRADRRRLGHQARP